MGENERLVGWVPHRRGIGFGDGDEGSGAARGHCQEVTNLGLEPAEKWWLETAQDTLWL